MSFNRHFSKPNTLKKKSLIIDTTFILDTDIEAYQDLRVNMMIYFHILLVHLGGNACFEYLAFTVLMESCTIRGTMMVWSFFFFFWFL